MGLEGVCGGGDWVLWVVSLDSVLGELPATVVLFAVDANVL